MKGEEGKGGEGTELNILKGLESNTLDRKGKGTWYVPGEWEGSLPPAFEKGVGGCQPPWSVRKGMGPER